MYGSVPLVSPPSFCDVCLYALSSDVKRTPSALAYRKKRWMAVAVSERNGTNSSSNKPRMKSRMWEREKGIFHFQRKRERTQPVRCKASFLPPSQFSKVPRPVLRKRCQKRMLRKRRRRYKQPQPNLFEKILRLFTIWFQRCELFRFRLNAGGYFHLRS
jgi:hypothetical protein